MFANKIIAAFGPNGFRWVHGESETCKAGGRVPPRRMTLARAIDYAFYSPVMWASGNSPFPHSYWVARDLIHEAIEEIVGERETITFFNDHIARSFSDIVALLKRAEELQSKRLGKVA